MVMRSKTLVNIPDDQGIHVKSAGQKGEKYVYKYVKYFRNAEGQPRNQAKAIGKYDPESGKMFPNNNYFELYQIDPVMPDVEVASYGYSYIVLKVCRDMGLYDCLVSAFGEQRAMDVIVMAAYMIREGGAMDGIDDWIPNNRFTNYNRLLTSQSSSKIFASLAAGQLNGFFIDWVKAAMGTGTVCYDVTSISSYAQQMTSVERGYNRDGEDLPQFNLGMFCDEKSKTPLYYNRYNGSLTDKTNLSFVLANAKEVGIHRVKMVVDGGFWDNNCHKSLYNLCDSFIMGMPPSLKESQNILEAHSDNITTYANELDIPFTYCIPVETTVCGIPGKALLYFDEHNHVHLCNELSDKINSYKAELAALVRYPKSKLKRFEQYFIITKRKDGRFDYAVDVEKADKARKYKGFFLLFTTDMEATPEDTLYHYRAKDAVEKIFDQIKCDMDGNRIRTYNEQTTDGKVFVTFVGCIIRSYLLNKLSQYMKDNSTTLKKAFNQLMNIQIISNSNGIRFTKALTKKQKEILRVFDAERTIMASLR